MSTNEIKIIGVAAAGNQVLERIPFGAIQNADFIVCDVDAKNLAKSSVHRKILLGTGIVQYLSIERQVEIGGHSVLNSELEMSMNSAIDSFEEIDSLFDRGSKKVILVARLGEIAATGITPVIAQIAKKRRLFVVAMVYTPFDFETETIKKSANKGLNKLRDDCDFVFVIKHSKISKLYGNLSFKSSFGKADDIIIRLTKILVPSGPINDDWLDLKLFFKKYQNDKPFFIGIGECAGNGRAKGATELALKHTLSEREIFEGVSNVLIQINYGNIKITTDEIKETSDAILGVLKKMSPVTISLSEDISLGDTLLIMVIAY